MYSNDFSNQLYAQFIKILPDTTSRSFSRDCGMSEGYWGSISSQNLPISTQALIRLLEALEHKKTIFNYTNNTCHIDAIKRLQATITEEIANRSEREAKATNGTIRKMLYEAMIRRAEERFDPFSSAPPISIGF